ncbi:MAG: heat shock protein GrpE [Bacteroidetes bacterium ADurb.Bin302]|nr:MAG: heat shock protein GrpE [Bacteroidetes bacterium ADurb.Bin302]
MSKHTEKKDEKATKIVDSEVTQETQAETIENVESASKSEENDDFESKYMQLNDFHLRLMADFDNYKKKTLKEKSDLIKYNGEKIFVNMLPIIDDFERAIDHLPEEDNPIKEGIILIHSKFIGFLNQNGVKEIKTKDEKFDTDFHEAVTLFPSGDEKMKGKIIDCVQKGYTFHDKVIRYAKVVVAD